MKLTSIGLPALAAVAVLFLAPLDGARAENDSTLKQGRSLFTEQAEPPCALCHTLKDAEASGTIGPSLDVMQPESEVVLRAVTHGIGPMMPYDNLSEEEKQILADYVSQVAGQ